MCEDEAKDDGERRARSTSVGRQEELSDGESLETEAKILYWQNNENRPQRRKPHSTHLRATSAVLSAFLAPHVVYGIELRPPTCRGFQNRLDVENVRETRTKAVKIDQVLCQSL